MHKYVAAAFSIAIAFGPPAAAQTGVGLQAGGVGVGASVGVGRTGTSIGAGASIGGLGGAAAASVGTGNGSIGASIGASGHVGGASAGLSAGSGGVVSSATGAAGASPGQSAAASSSTGSSTAATTARVAPVDRVRQSITLPQILLPSGGSDRASAATAFDEIPGTPAAVVRACRDAVGSAAAPFGVVSVRARSAGSLRRLSRGAISASVQVRIHYARQGGPEIRQARIRCHLDASGKVIKLT